MTSLQDKNVVIAVDGPAASGKSTVSKGVASRLGYLYVDSGALYRVVTWFAAGRRVDVSDSDRLLGCMNEMGVDFFVRHGSVCFVVDGVEPGDELRTGQIDANVSPVAAIAGVRTKVGEWLRSMTDLGSLVVEGRDIGTVVFPDAQFKFYLDASADERARRRHSERGAAEGASLCKVSESLMRRDDIDSGRKVAPLRMAEGAIVIDSTAMSVDEVIAFVVETVESGHEV